MKTTPALTPDHRPLTPVLFRLILDEPAPGSWNMAVDEALLAAAAESVDATLRLYQWAEPTLSLGYFQRYAERQQHAASRACAVVRRASGGGAILHDHELTYSLVLPAGQPLAAAPNELYFRIHRALADVLAKLTEGHRAGGAFRLWETDSAPPAGRESFLCFQRRFRGDVLWEPAGNAAEDPTDQPGWKLVGSAQRRRRGAILQHGSLLVARSPRAAELPGVSDVTGMSVTVAQLAAALPSVLGRTLEVELEEAELPAAIRSAARELERTKYASSTWTKRR